MVPASGLPHTTALASSFAHHCFFSNLSSLLLEILQWPLIASRIKSNLLGSVMNTLPNPSFRSPFLSLFPLHPSLHLQAGTLNIQNRNFHVRVLKLLFILFLCLEFSSFLFNYSFIPFSRLCSIITPFSCISIFPNGLRFFYPQFHSTFLYLFYSVSAYNYLSMCLFPLKMERS